MSNLVFPSTLKGFGIDVVREPYTRVATQVTLGGRRYSETWWTQPLYRYTLNITVRGGTYAEFQSLAGFWGRHFGGLDSFLFLDPEDNAVTAHPFSVGNGSAYVFQMQRTLAQDADLAAPASRAYWPAYSDGYEPVREFVSAPSIYDNGTLKTVTTHYTISSTGAITFVTPTANGHVLTWTGSFYRRVRFATDGLPMTRVVSSWWDAKTIQLESVK